MDNEYLKQIYGLLESGATLGTGAVSGLVGLPYGLYKGVTSGAYGTPEAPRIAAREAQQFMERNTYQPRTAEGQANLQQLAGLLEASKLPPVMPEASLLAAIPKQAYAAQAERAGMAAEKAIAPVVTRTMERGGLPAQLLEDLSQGSVRPIQAWHGSGNLFPEFDVTRAPEQGYAYTRGSYAAAAKREAEGKYMPRDPVYEEKLMGLYKNAEKKQDYDSMEVLEAAMLHQSPSDLRKTFVQSGDYEDAFAKKASGLIDKIETFPKESYLYKLDVKDEALPQMLQYDNPIGQQSKQVQEFAKELGLKDTDLGGDLIGQLIAKDVTGLQIQETMKQRGIPGLIYNSPDVQGSVNYVTYDPSLYKILEINDKPYEQWFPEKAGGGLLGQSKAASAFDVSRRDASDIFGAGAERVIYKDPKSGGTMEVLAKPDGTASVLSLEVPETSRGKGIGQSLQAQVMQDFPEMMGQVSSKAAAKTAYRLGRRPPFKPDATLEDVYKMMDEDSSVNLVSPEMQKRFRQSLLD